MKSQIIHLEPFDSLASVRDKFHWRQAERIVLVLPTQRNCGIKKEIGHRLGMVLLQRYAVSCGLKIALVTKDPSIEKLANEVGVPVFDDVQLVSQKRSNYSKRHFKRKISLKKIRAYQQKKWEIYKKYDQIRLISKDSRLFARESISLKQRKINKKFITLFVLGVIAVFCGFVFLPSAEIILTPQRINQEKTIEVIAKIDQSEVSLNGVIPMHTKEIMVSGEKEIRTTEKERVLFGDVHGKVRLVNMSQREVIVPKDSIITLQNREELGLEKMITLEEIVLPPKNSNTQNEEYWVDVILSSRDGYNEIPPLNGNLALESPIGLDVTAAELKIDPLQVRRLVPIASDKDRERLRNLLLNELFDEFRKGREFTFIKENNKDSEINLSEKPREYIVLSEKFVPEENIPSEVIKLSLIAKFKWDVALGKDYLQLGKKVLDEYFGEMESNFIPREDVTAVFLAIPKPTHKSKGSYSTKIKYYRQMVEKIQQDEVYGLIRGMSINQAINVLEKRYKLEEKPTISIHPNWWSYLPLVPFRYTIKVQ